MERNLTQVAMFAALIAALGLVPAITLGFGVPISAQTLGVMLAGAVLGWKRGLMAILLFILLVALGLPLLAGGRGGLAAFTAPTTGFLLGWIPGVIVTGLIVEHLRLPSPGVVAGIAALIGEVGVVYVCGIAGMSIKLGKTPIEAALLAIAFIPGDLLKVVATGAIVQALARARPQSINWLA